MKAKRSNDGTWTIQGIPETTLIALAHLTGDLGAGNCVLRFDERSYEKWARPNKATRKALRKFAASTDGEGTWWDWDDHYDVTEKPKFARKDFA